MNILQSHMHSTMLWDMIKHEISLMGTTGIGPPRKG